MWWMLTAALAQELPVQEGVPVGEPVPVGETVPLGEPVVVAEPVALTAEQRVDEARRRMAAGDWEGTRIVLAEALARWDTMLSENPTDDVRFRRAETLAALGRVEEAQAALDALGDPAGRSPADRSKIELLHGMWRIQLGEVKPGLRALDEALTRVPPGELPQNESRARVVLVETAATAAAGIAFTGSDRKKKKALERRALLVKGIQDQLVLLIRLADPPSVIRGFVAAVRAYDDLGAALLAETPPKRLDAEQLRLNRALLAGRVSNVWVKASQLAEMGEGWSAQVGYTGPGTAELAARRVALEQRIESLPLPSR
ncbi:MAG: tetratricopeptide repeat protein [Deltaproteobacteria bacterium]|nr:tetratricopeptide repeat protein [Deltaproteobacteria bacterium]